MIGGGPFRDTAPAMIAHARDELAKLRDQRAALQARYEEAHAALTKLVDPDLSRRSFKFGLLCGVIVTLVVGLATLASRR
jgi:hypothetical protein